MGWDESLGSFLGKRRLVRSVRTPGGTASSEVSETRYLRSYAPGACSINDNTGCYLRVDSFEPGAPGELRRASRTVFPPSDWINYQKIYGRPLAKYTYMLGAEVVPTTATLDSAMPSTGTTFTYEGDGHQPQPSPTDTSLGFHHNTRVTAEMTRWCVDANCVSGRGSRVVRSEWDGHGHFGRTETREWDGTSETTLRVVAESFLNRTSSPTCPTCWLLDPVITRTVSRPAVSGLDEAGANLSTTETFEYDSTGFQSASQIVDSEPEGSRTLRHEWTKGTAAYANCTAIPTAFYPECNNIGFPIRQVDKLTGSFSGYPVNSTYTRGFYYRNSTPSAAYDFGTSFYVLDDEIGPTGKPVSERGSDGRYSLMDYWPQLTTVKAYDTLGRLVSVQPPGEGAEEISYTAQSITRVKKTSSGLEASRHETYFDELGRQTGERRRMPDGAWSCRLLTYDVGGRQIGQTEWWTNAESEIVGLCDNLLNLQAALGPGNPRSSTPAGTTWSEFDVLGRPGKTRLADGAVFSDVYQGWWRQESKRTVNLATPVRTVIERDALGQVTAVVEPETKKADGLALMNPEETTAYRYDHQGRVISIRKVGSDASGGSPLIQVRTRRYDDFGWLLSMVDPEQPNQVVPARDARGNVLRVKDGVNEIVKTYDAGGRILNSRREGESSTYDWDGQPATWYEYFAYDSLPGFEFGSSNGKLVWSIRANHILSNRDTVDFGWSGVTSYYHYNGLGGRLGFRQQSDMLMPEPALQYPELVVALGSSKKPPLVDEFRRYFERQGKVAKTSKDLRKAAASESVARSAALGSPTAPSGPAHWRYTWDSAGRLQSMTYPRRDEGFATQVTFGYQAGFLTSMSASFQDPLAYATVGTATATLAYDPSGGVRETTVSTSALSGPVLRLFTDRDVNGLPRLQSWDFHRRSGGGTTPHEERTYGYDHSGNITAISSRDPVTDTTHLDSYLYDARQRLIRDELAGRAAQVREFDGFGNLTSVVGPSAILVPTDRTTNRLASSLAAYDNAGRMLEDGSRKASASDWSVGRDYYPDGAVMSEFSHWPNSNSTVYPYGNSAWLLDGRAEVALSFWGDAMNCQTEQFTSKLRDENARLLTQYRAAPSDPGCTCATVCEWQDRFHSDVVRMGPYLTASFSRDSGLRLEARDHLGTPRIVTDFAGTIVSSVRLESFGQKIVGTGNAATSEYFTGHERNHVTGDGNQLPISDYMHARTYVPMLGRFTRPDPADSFSVFDPQSLNRYTYARNNPLKYVDKDGREVTFANDQLRSVVTRLSVRSPSIRETLGRYSGPGSPNLHFQRGAVPPDLGGERAYGNFRASIVEKYDAAKILTTKDSLPDTGKNISGIESFSGAVITLDNGVTSDKGVKSVLAHEIGHAEQAAKDPVDYLRRGADDVIKPNGKLIKHDQRPLEDEAIKYQERVFREAGYDR